jgi:hypothetical protein
MKRYEFKEHNQLWDNKDKCWIIWETVSGKIGIGEEFKKELLHVLNNYGKSFKRYKQEMSTTDAMHLKGCR